MIFRKGFFAKDRNMNVNIVIKIEVSKTKTKAIAMHLFAVGLNKEEVLEMLVGVAVFRWGLKEQVERQVKSIKKTRPNFQGKGPFKGEDVHILAIWALFTPPLEKAIRDYFRKIVEEAFALYCSHQIKAS